MLRLRRTIYPLFVALILLAAALPQPVMAHGAPGAAAAAPRAPLRATATDDVPDVLHSSYVSEFAVADPVAY
jgi:hypothetical protein